MESIDDIQQYQIYVDVIPVDTGEWAFVYRNKSIAMFPEFDFHLPVFLTRSNEVYEYVEISRDDKIEVIERQEVNPFFIELSFFDSIEQSKVLYGSDLTIDMINFIRSVRPELLEATNVEIMLWFDQIGINEIPWHKGTSNEVTLDDIDKINILPNHIISKANYFNIDINK